MITNISNLSFLVVLSIYLTLFMFWHLMETGIDYQRQKLVGHGVLSLDAGHITETDMYHGDVNNWNGNVVWQGWDNGGEI